MKGLLLKDFYMLWKYCRLPLLLVFIWIPLMAFGQSPSMGVFPCLIAGMLPMSVQAYDEREKWSQYSGALPYTKSQLVAVKYIYSLILCGITVGLLFISATISALYSSGSIPSLRLMAFWGSVYVLIFAFVSLCMPFVFKFGAEKGRLAYMVFGGLCGVSSVFLANANELFNLNGAHQLGNSSSVLSVCIVAVIAAAIFAGSWLLSIAFYRKREL